MSIAPGTDGRANNGQHLTEHHWQPGQSGNPAGAPKGYVSFPAVLRRELAKTDRRNRSQLEKIATKVVQMAIAGDMDAVRWLADRVDGKVAQNVNVSSEQTVHVVPWLPAVREAVNGLTDSSTAVEIPDLTGEVVSADGTASSQD